MANSSILKELCDKLGLSVNAFEKAIGVSQSTISTAIRRDSAIKKDTIEKIIKAFPKVDKLWLISGTGKMFLPDTENNLQNIERHNIVKENDVHSTSDFSLTPKNENLMNEVWMKMIETLVATNAQLVATNAELVAKVTPAPGAPNLNYKKERTKTTAGK